MRVATCLLVSPTEQALQPAHENLQITRDCRQTRRDRILDRKPTLNSKRGELELNVKITAKFAD